MEEMGVTELAQYAVGSSHDSLPQEVVAAAAGLGELMGIVCLTPPGA
jgi:hypothetical protein